MHTDTFSFEVENEGEVYSIYAKRQTFGDSYMLLITYGGTASWIAVSRDVSKPEYKIEGAYLNGTKEILSLEQKISDKIINRNL